MSEAKRFVYADNAATTAMSRTAVEAMLPYLDKIYGNPSSLHSVGQVAQEVCSYMGRELKKTVAKEEIGFLAIHIQRVISPETV